jgi:O-antigen ligase
MHRLKNETSMKWGRYLDNTILFLGAAVPVGIVIGNAGFEAMVSLAGLAWIARAVILRENPFSRIITNPAVLAWAAWLGCIVLSLALNGAGSKGALHDIVFIRFFLFACALLDLSTRRQISRYFIWGLATGVLFAGVNTLLAYGAGSDLFGRSIDRYTSKLKEPARFAGLCAMAAPFFLTWALTARAEKSKYWGLFLIIGVTALVILVQTTIRTAIIASFSGIFFGILFFRYKKMGWIEKIFWPVLLATGIWITVHWVEGDSLRTFYDRIAIWKISVAMWQENFLLGVGVSAYKDAYAVFALSGTISPYVAPTGEVFDITKAYHAHNLFLMLLSSTGILGLVSFLWLFACCIWGTVKNTMQWKSGLATWPVVFLVNGLAGSNIYNSWYQALFAFFAVLALTGRQVQPVSET